MPYPPVIARTDYPVPPALDVVGECPLNLNRCAITSLTLDAHPASGTGLAPDHAPLEPHAAGRFLMAPAVETFAIKWRFSGFARVRKVKFELFRRTGVLPFWTKTIEWAAGPTAAEGTTQFDGNLATGVHLAAVPAATNVAVAYAHAAAFPRDYLTVEHAPYKLLMRIAEVEDQTQIEAVARLIYIDVMVHDIAVALGPEAWIPPVAPANHLETRQQALRIDAFRALARDLQGAAAALPAITSGTAPAAVKLSLKSHVFAKSARDFYRNTVFAEMKELWGDGPAIPLVATVRVRQSDGAPAAAQAGAVGLGGLHFLWDWTSGGATGLAPATHDTARAFLGDAIAYKAGDWPHAYPNCHAEHGGKRGAAGGVTAPHFAAVPGVAAWALVAAANRPWATFTPLIDDPNDANGGKTGVLFLPSRIAGDSYKPRFAAAYPTRAALDVANADTFNAALSATRNAASTTTLTTWRRVHVARHWRKNAGVDAASMSWATIANFFKPAFLDLVAPAAGVENMTQVNYETALANVRARFPVALDLALAPTAGQHNGDHAITYLAWGPFQAAVQANALMTQQMLTAMAPATDADVLNAQALNRNRFHEDLFIESLAVFGIANPAALATRVLRDAQITSESSYKEKAAGWGDGIIGKICGRYSRNVNAAEEGIHFFQFEFNDNWSQQTEVAEAATTVANWVNCPSCNTAVPPNPPPLWWSDAASDANRICANCNFRFYESCAVISYAPHRYMNGVLDAAANNLPFMARMKIRAGRKYGTTANISIAHEVGHQLGMPHAGPNAKLGPFTVMQTGGIEPALHDAADAACIMSYNFTLAPQLHFCGLCNLRIRGWSNGPSNVALAFENAADQNTVALSNQRAQNRV